MLISFVDFLLVFLLVLVFMLWYRVSLSINIIWLPVFLLLLSSFSMGVTLWASALNVRYRDIKYVIPFVIQFGMYVSPIGFSTEVIANEWRWLYSLNPLVGVIDGFRWCLLGQEMSLYMPGMVLSVLLSVLLLLSGYLYFVLNERKMADII